YCYFFRLHTEDDLFIKQWSATFTPGVKRMSVFFPSTMLAPEGTLTSQESCDPVEIPLPVPNAISWGFTAHSSGDQFVYPLDAGNGTPVGLRAAAGQPAVLWIYMLNETNAVIRPRVEVTGLFYPLDTNVTRADSFITYISNIVLPPATLTT